MNAPIAPPLPPYHHTPLFPLGPDETPYRKLDIPGLANNGVRVETAMGGEMVVVPREAFAPNRRKPLSSVRR